MKFLAFIFMAMSLYGFCTGYIGAALMSAFMVAFVLYGERQLDKRDADFFADPRSAQVPDKDIIDLLERHKTEAGRDHL